MENIQHEEHFIIRTYEIDNHKVATIPALVKLMHEAAMQNVIRLKISVWDLEPDHISWVLVRKKLQINRLPVLGEKVRVITYPSGFEKFFTYRDYKVYDETNQLVAWSSSTWLLMDTQERRMRRIPEYILAYREDLPSPEECLPRPQGKIITPEQFKWQKSFKVGWHDLDFNQHLNNTYYVQWMMEALPDQVLQGHRLEELNIVYRSEGLWKDRIRSECSRLGPFHYVHRLVRESDDKELASAESKWN